MSRKIHSKIREKRSRGNLSHTGRITTMYECTWSAGLGNRTQSQNLVSKWEDTVMEGMNWFQDTSYSFVTKFSPVNTDTSFHTS